MPEQRPGMVTARQLKRAIAATGWSVTEAAKQLQVDRRTIHRWVAGDDMPIDKVALLAEKAELPIRLEFGVEHKEAPPPRWAEELAAETARAVVLQLIAALRTPGEAADILRRFRELARSLPPSGAGSPRVDDEQSDQAKGKRRGRGT